NYNREKSMYMESLDEKLQIILQRLDKIEVNRSSDGDKSTWKEIETPIAPNSCEGRTKELINSRGLPKQREGDKAEQVKEKGRVHRSKKKGATKHIPKKKICKTRAAKDGKKRPRLDKLIVELEHQEKIPDRDRKYRWEIGRQEHRGLKRINSDRIEKEKLKQIEQYIKRRCQIIDEEQGRMIVSLLEKPFNHAVIDKLLKNQNNTRVLTCDSEKAQVYALLEKVQEKWFEALDKDISEKE
ncbi:3826_t:CDS:2, partial [Gigaspora margarita]